jgi:hypothetical protein
VTVTQHARSLRGSQRDWAAVGIMTEVDVEELYGPQHNGRLHLSQSFNILRAILRPKSCV